MPETPAIELRGLTKQYGDVTAVEDVSLTVPPGSRTAGTEWRGQDNDDQDDGGPGDADRRHCAAAW